MDWGNAIVRKVTRSPSGKVTDIEMDLHLAGDFKTTEKKITWLSKPTSSHNLVPVTLLDYDYLITKRKLEDDDKIADVANRNTEFRVDGLADSNVLTKLKKSDIIQFERKGYFILDNIIDQDGQGQKRLEFIRIPDGRAAGLALKAVVPDKKAKKDEGGSSADSVKMYKVDPINTSETIETQSKMYKVKSVYDM